MFESLEKTAHELWADTPPLRRRIYLYAVLFCLACIAMGLLYWRAVRAANLRARRKALEAKKETQAHTRIAEEAAGTARESDRDLEKIEAEFEVARMKEREALRELDETLARIREAKRWEELRMEYDAL